MQFYAMCVRKCVYSADVESFLCLLTCEDNELEAHGLKEKISVLIPTTWRTLQEKDNSHINKTTTGYKTRYHKSQRLRVLFQLILASSHICIPLQSRKLDLFDCFSPYKDLLRIEKREAWVSLL